SLVNAWSPPTSEQMHNHQHNLLYVAYLWLPVESLHHSLSDGDNPATPIRCELAATISQEPAYRLCPKQLAARVHLIPPGCIHDQCEYRCSSALTHLRKRR